ncbi:hypothetical protein HMPREF9999_00526 [Alloprevotella sp. oral taxon 473 str. F0040]|nr:hypothetical protein HMPREF9999_00526 [Alloprevotella sp. oral taxon 473 str. F0040]
MYGHCAKEVTHAVGIRPNADGSADYFDYKLAAATLSLKEPTQIEVYRTAIFQNILLFNLYVHYFV